MHRATEAHNECEWKPGQKELRNEVGGATSPPLTSHGLLMEANGAASGAAASSMRAIVKDRFPF